MTSLSLFSLFFIFIFIFFSLRGDREKKEGSNTEVTLGERRGSTVVGGGGGEEGKKKKGRARLLFKGENRTMSERGGLRRWREGEGEGR